LDLGIFNNMRKQYNLYTDTIVEYEDSEEIRNIVFDKVIDFFKEYNCFSGEIICQSDDPQIYASELLSDIADNVIKAKYIDVD